jgi:hypothetical protein
MTQDERFDRIDAILGEIKVALGGLTGRVGALEETVRGLTRYMLDFRDEVARRLEFLENRVDILAANVKNMDDRFPILTKATLDFGRDTTYFNNELSQHQNAIAELNRRLERLEHKPAA